MLAKEDLAFRRYQASSLPGDRRPVSGEAADIDVGNAILSHVADISGTLIVMGGYGHPKLRELILGA